MLFNSLEFLVFFPIVTALYFLLPHRWRWLHLLTASCIFYMAFVPVYILILFFTIIIDYIAGIWIEGTADKRRQKRFLILSLIANIGVLAVFKYYNFFIDNMNELLMGLNIATKPMPFLSILLPIGLSFHTFQAMSYTIEVYRGNQKAERHFGIYALYVMFYPQLVAGPIERPQNLLNQFREKHQFDSQQFLDGLRLMLWGFFKKLVIADRLSIYVDTVFNQPQNYHYGNLIIATLFFTIQIYCDFSGYSDIAIGAARTMGFKLMTNFNRPYFARSIQEFWKRWHISLSTWFKDYVFIPLGGSRRNLRKTCINISIVFLLSGLWHGANWTFIAWGALHAFFMVCYLTYKHYDKKQNASTGFSFISIGFTFLLVALAWIFFRANNVADAFLMVKHIVTGYSGVPFQMVLKNVANNYSIVFTNAGLIVSGLMIALMFLLEKKLPSNLFVMNKKPVTDVAFCSVILSLIILFGVFQNQSFIYFQF
ncbi:MAG TPA: MBOAT family O-acyltransferase [Flavipsychrobacter sp.]|nr:MBOAT family O-acyltransferase [Flavipsychrobacter sp.]